MAAAEKQSYDNASEPEPPAPAPAPRVVRRFRKVDALPSERQADDPLEDCLRCWKRWLKDFDRDLGVKTTTVVDVKKSKKEQAEEAMDRANNPLQQGYDDPPPDEIEHKRERLIGEATDAMIDSLRACDRWAIYYRCQVATQWKFPLLNFADALVVAEAALTVLLKKNLATEGLWW